MKKNNLPDFRRETKQIFENNSLDVIQIANSCGVSVSAVYNWKSGRQSPSKRNFEQLKHIASGGLAQTHSPDSKPPDDLARIMGQIDLITKQIAQLQGDVAVLRNNHEIKLMDSEKKIGELEARIETVGAALEQSSSRFSREKKAG